MTFILYFLNYRIELLVVWMFINPSVFQHQAAFRQEIKFFGKYYSYTFYTRMKILPKVFFFFFFFFFSELIELFHGTINKKIKKSS